MAETNEAKATKKRGPLDPNSPAGIRNAWAKAEREYHEQYKRVEADHAKLLEARRELERRDGARRDAAKRMTEMLASALGAAVVPPKDGAA